MIKINPTDQSLLDKLTIEKSFDHNPLNTDETVIFYKVYLNNLPIGRAEIIDGYNHISAVRINKKFQRQGVATFLYNYIENDLDIKLKPHNFKLKDGEKFWRDRNEKKK